jgi:AAA domain
MVAPHRESYQSNSSNNTYDFDKGREAVCEAVPIETYARKHSVIESFGGGGWFNGPCTLGDHEAEDKPFYISPAGAWRCEACDQGGDVVDLAMLCGGYDSPEAAMLALAVEYGVELPHERNGHEPGRLAEAPRRVSQVSLSLNRGVTPVTPLRFAEMELPGPREHLVQGLVPKMHTTTLFGDGGSAKSVLALSVGTAIAGGAERWLGRKVQNCPVLFADFELDADEQRRLAYQVARGVHLDKPPHDLLYVSGLGRPVAEVLEGCLDVCAREGVGLLILDSLGIALQGDAEWARDVIRFHHEYLDPFRAAGVTLLVVDHQGKAQGGERYQSKRTFGSVYKENLARSVIQVEPGDRGEGLLTLKLRQTKHNFGPKAEPIGTKLTFTEESITVDVQSLDATELAEEAVLNAGDRVMLALKGGPAYPTDIAETCIMPLGTVKNELTRLRKRGLVEYTGEVEGQARQVCLTNAGLSVTGVTRLIGSVTPVTPGAAPPLANVRVNEQGEAEF